jgi:hypothetical protein
MRQSFSKILLPTVFLAFMACKGRQPTNSGADGLSSSSFLGSWQATRVYIDLGKVGPEGTKNLVFDPEATAKEQNKKPLLTVFNADGSYREDTYSLSDSLLTSKSGYWHYQDDSLYMRLEGAGSHKNAFKVTAAGRTLQLVSKLDWNGDGLKDDRMQVELRRP